MQEINSSIMIHSLTPPCHQRTFFPRCFPSSPQNKKQQRSEEPMATFLPPVLNYLFRHQQNPYTLQVSHLNTTKPGANSSCSIKSVLRKSQEGYAKCNINRLIHDYVSMFNISLIYDAKTRNWQFILIIIIILLLLLLLLVCYQHYYF